MVTVSAEPWDTIQQKLPSAWLTGQGPDIAAPAADPNETAQHVKTNSVLPITATGEVDGEINVDQFAPALVDASPTTTPCTPSLRTTPHSASYRLVLADNNTIQIWPVLQWLEDGDIAPRCVLCASNRSARSF